MGGGAAKVLTNSTFTLNDNATINYAQYGSAENNKIFNAVDKTCIFVTEGEISRK